MDDTPPREVDGASTIPDKIALCDTGDVVLILQDNQEVILSSHFLTHCSPTFRALFGPSFAEGQQRRSVQDPQRIELHDDDPQAMVDLCSILHLKPLCSHIQVEDVRDAINRILGFAIVADKYDACLAVQDSAIGMLARFFLGGTTDLAMATLADLILAAYLLGLSRHFTIFTSRLVQHHADDYSDLVSIAERMKASVIDQLEEQRSAARRQVAAQIDALLPVSPWCSKCNAATSASKYSLFHIYERIFMLESAVPRLRTVRTRSLSFTRKCLSLCRDIWFAADCAKGHAGTLQVNIAKAEIQKIADGIPSLAHGLCFICVNATPGACTHKAMMQEYVLENERL